jgi:hypothetical protein
MEEELYYYVLPEQLAHFEDLGKPPKCVLA